MRFGLEAFIAGRYLRSKRKEVFISIITIISVLGVAISVLVLDVVLSVMTGFEAELRDKLLGASAHIVVRRFGGDMDRWEELTEKIKKVPGVVTADPYTQNQAMITGSSGAFGLLIRGIPQLEEPVSKLKKIAMPGTHVEDLFEPMEIEVTRPDGKFDTVKLPPLLIGKALREKLGAARGTPVTLLAPELTVSPQGLSPKLRRFVIVGSYHSGLVDYETALAYTSLSEAQRFFQLGGGVTGIEVRVKDLFQAAAIARQIETSLGKDSPYIATDWKQTNKEFWEMMQLEQRVYFIVLLLLVLVASFSIVSTLVMVVMEKNKDIAVLKTIGATNRMVRGIFLLQGSLIGICGTIIGTMLGVAGCLLLREYGFPIEEKVFGLRTVPVHMIPQNFAAVAIAGFLITALAGIYPALRAARIRPAESLRYE